MLDKIHLNGQEPPKMDFLEGLPRSSIARLSDSQYQEAYRLSFSPTKAMTVKMAPRMGHISPLAIEANPSQWDSWKELLEAFKRVSKPSELLIDRIDHAVDYPLPFQKVHECIRVKLKHHFKRFKESEAYSKGFLTGVYYGEKPEVICIYDKGYLLSGKKLKPVPGAEVGIRTRFEVRQFRRKVAFPKLADIHKYREINPFESIQYCELAANESEQRAQDLRSLVSSDGLHLAYHQLNQSNNFTRTFKKYFQERDFASELHEIHREDLRKSLGEV